LRSPQMRAIGRLIEEVADTDVTVLIRGECGAGKDHVARAIHAASARRDHPFVKVNCAAVPVELLESELFGHERGAVNGAHRMKPGQFELADQGTIYLDEIAELPLALQAKLLHVLQDLRFTRVGSCRSLGVDTRVIAATSQDLEDAIVRGEFCPDLYDRLKVVEIQVPPLRERPEEIPALVAEFLAKFNARYGRSKEISPAAMGRLIVRPWPGNVRELENVIRRLVVLDREQALDAPESLREVVRRAVREAERRVLQDVLERVRWNRTEAAQILKIGYETLLNKIAEHRLAPSGRV